MKRAEPGPEERTEILIYRTEDGRTKVSTLLANETLWLSLNQISELYHRDKSVISRHIKHIFKDRELAREAVVAKYATTAADEKTYRVTYYNLDMVLAIGYRVRSPRGVQFRQWATERLREYIVKGFTLDDDRLKGVDRHADAAQPNMGLASWSGGQSFRNRITHLKYPDINFPKLSHGCALPKYSNHSRIGVCHE